MTFPKGAREMPTILSCWTAKGSPIIVMARKKALKRCTSASSQPNKINQMTLTRKLMLPPWFSRCFPKGAKLKLAILKHCKPTGIPTMVRHQIRPASIHVSHEMIPPNIIQMTLPRQLTIDKPQPWLGVSYAHGVGSLFEGLGQWYQLYVRRLLAQFALTCGSWDQIRLLLPLQPRLLL